MYQPEVAAEAIVWAAHHRRREMQVGLSSVLTIRGNKLMPGFMDWYLGKNAFWGQQTDQPVQPDRPDNLFEPVAGDYEAHGSFEDEAKAESKELTLSFYRDWIVGGIGFLVLLIFLFIIL